VAVKTSPRVTVTCSGCGFGFELSRRNELEHERRGQAHLCRDCRIPAKPRSPELLAAMRRWWLANYTLEELRSWPTI